MKHQGTKKSVHNRDVAVKVRFQPKRVLASQNVFGLESQSKRVWTEIFSQSAFSAKTHLD